MKISILFIFLSFLADQLNSKNIMCMQILHIPNDCSATGHLPFPGWDSVHVQAVIGELWPQNLFKTVSKCTSRTRSLTSGASVQLVRPHSDYWMCVTVSKQKFCYSFPGAYAEIWGNFPQRKCIILLINIHDIHTSIWIVLQTCGHGAQLFCNNTRW